MTIADLSSRFWGDPAEHLDEWRALHARLVAAEQELKDRARRRKARRIRKLAKLAKASMPKGKA